MLKLLDDGLDEMAARAFEGLAMRMVATVGVTALVTMMLPWRLCLAWLAVQTVSEATSALVTRPQSRGETVGPWMRLAHLGTVISGCSLWTLLGCMLWASGTPEGVAGALILWLSVIFFAQNTAYQSTTGFLVGGGIPALGMLGFMTLGPNWLRMPLIPVVGLDLVALGFVADGVMRSLAVRRRFEETQAKLVASESQYRMLADNITDVLWLNQYDGQRIYVSPSVKRALGFAPEEVFDSNFGMIHPDDAPAAQAAIRKVALDGGETTLQCRMVHKDGRAVWMETNVGVVPGANGGQAMMVSVSRNIEARKALETELVEARQRAEDAAAAKSDFLANMTHELRTPLNAIVGFSGVLKGSPRLHPDDARHAHLISDASDTLLLLVNSVLDFSRLEAGAVELEAKPFDPAAPARATAAMLAEQAVAKGLDLSVRCEGEMRPMVGDAARIHQVLLNLLSNALKFTAEGGVAVNLRQGPAEDGRGMLRIDVADTGIGVAREQIAALFDRFTQADATVSRKYGGTGLGLAICKRTVELMGGRMGCDSTPGEGSTFWFELALPYAEALEQAAEDAAPSGPEAPLRVLLVEDVAVNRELIATLLAPFDVAIETAENGALAVEAMRHGRFDLVLMDVQMPVMDGLSATRAIRALPGAHAAATPIIAMTANVLPDQVRKCREAGMDDHIGKPISPASLLGALARWSDGRDEVEERERA